MPVNDKYNTPSTYGVFSSSGSENEESCGCSTPECGCCPVGTVAVHDCNGNFLGCLTPNDAENYKNSQVEVPEGYVKVFHPTTGEFLGIVTPEKAIELIDYLVNGVINNVAVDSFNVVAPVVAGSGFVELSSLLADPKSADVTLTIDRLNMDEPISVSIIGTAQDIQFDPSGTSTVIPTVSSEKIVAFTWGGTVPVGVHTFTLRLSSTSVVRDIPFQLTLS